MICSSCLYLFIVFQSLTVRLHDIFELLGGIQFPVFEGLVKEKKKGERDDSLKTPVRIRFRASFKLPELPITRDPRIPRRLQIPSEEGMQAETHPAKQSHHATTDSNI